MDVILIDTEGFGGMDEVNYSGYIKKINFRI